MGVFFTPLDIVFSSPSRVRLVRTLLNLGHPVSGRDAARRARLSLPIAQRALADLVAIGVVQREETSSQHLYQIDEENMLVRDALQPLFAGERKRVDAVFDRLRDLLGGAKGHARNGVLTAVIFGSAARGEDEPGSDFDLLVVTVSRDRVDTLHRVLSDFSPELWRLFGLTLSPVVVDLKGLRRQHAHGDGFTQNGLRDGRTVVGASLEDVLNGAARMA